MAHDLKIPLSIISGYVQNLAENVQTEKREYYAANIQVNVSRMDKIIREMLDLYRMEQDHLVIQPEEVHLRKICTALEERYQPVCSEKKITVYTEGDAVITADRSFMERVIDNFFVNALDHTPEGGNIRIQITASSFRFFNSGSHIPDERLEEIWKPYSKVDESRGNTKGTGLGLSIACTILNLHQLSYGVENVEDGVEFWFQIK